MLHFEKHLRIWFYSIFTGNAKAAFETQSVSYLDVPMTLLLWPDLSTMCNHGVCFPPGLLQPAALVERLSTYKSSVEEVELREKQLAAMRVDVCSSAALRKLKGTPSVSQCIPLASSH